MADGFISHLAPIGPMNDQPSISLIGAMVAGFIGLIRPRGPMNSLAKEFHMGVRSGVMRAEQLLKVKLEKDKQTQKLWVNLTKMRHFYA